MLRVVHCGGGVAHLFFCFVVLFCLSGIASWIPRLLIPLFSGELATLEEHACVHVDLVVVITGADGYDV